MNMSGLLSSFMVGLLIHGTAACGGATPKGSTSQESGRPDSFEAATGVEYSVLVEEIQGAHRLANTEMQEASRLYFSDDGQSFDPEQGPRARALFASAAKRIADLERSRAKARSAVPIIFVELAFVKSKAENGQAMIALAEGNHEGLQTHLNRMAEACEPMLEAISHALQNRKLRDEHARYEALRGGFADCAAKAHLLLGLEQKRNGDVAAARVHWKRSLQYPGSSEVRSAVNRLLEENR